MNEESIKDLLLRLSDRESHPMQSHHAQRIREHIAEKDQRIAELEAFAREVQHFIRDGKWGYAMQSANAIIEGIPHDGLASQIKRAQDAERERDEAREKLDEIRDRCRTVGPLMPCTPLARGIEAVIERAARGEGEG